MPLNKRGQQTLWFSYGVFLFICFLIVIFPASAMPVMLFFPAIYYSQAIRFPKAQTAFLAALPGFLVFTPQLRYGALLYLIVLAASYLMFFCVKKNRIGMAVFVPTAFVFGLTAMFAFHLAGVEGLTINEQLSLWVGDMLNQLAAMYEQVLSADQMSEFRMQRYILQQRLTNIFPVMVLSALGFIFWFNLLASAFFDRRIVLRYWKSPDYIIAVFIAAAVLFTLPLGQTAAVVGLNILLAVLHVYFFQGMGILCCYLQARKWNMFFKWILYILIFTQIYIMVIISAIGLFDTWFDFRARIGNIKGEK